MSCETSVYLCKIILFVLLIYVCASLTEWTIHKYIMHAPSGWAHVLMGKAHIAHHMQVKEDMTLHNHDKDPQGVYFKYVDTLMLIIWFSFIVYVISKILSLQFSPTFIVGFSILSVVFHNFMWNCIHSKMHNHNAPYYDGIPRYDTFLYGTKLFDYLATYHAIHHMEKSDLKGNYNVCFPLADYLMGTYRKRIVKPWREEEDPEALAHICEVYKL